MWIHDTSYLHCLLVAIFMACIIFRLVFADGHLVLARIGQELETSLG